MATAAITCDLTYPGLEDWQGVNIMRSLGVVPDQIRVRFTPGDRPPASFGPLRFTYGGPGIGQRVLLLPDCQLDRVTAITTDNGFTLEATLLDPRWKWAYGTISGEYNIPDPKGEILKGTERTPQELATLLLKAMFNLPEDKDTKRKGSKRRAARLSKASPLPYDVKALPNDSRPRTEWDDDNPARMLDRLCESLGCVVVYKWNGTVKLERAGQGNYLVDDDDVTDLNVTLDPREVPDTVMIVTPEKRFEVVLPLEPVAIDTDRTYKDPYKVSYVPKASHPFTPIAKQGWLDGVDVLTDPVHLALAKESVFRCYRLLLPDAFFHIANNLSFTANAGYVSIFEDPLSQTERDFHLTIPGFGQVDNLWQILPVQDGQVGFSYDALSEDYSNKPATIFGLFQAYDEVGQPSDTSNNFDPAVERLDEEKHALPQDVGWSLDPSTGIVKLSAPLVRWGTPKLNGGNVEFTPYLFPVLWIRLTIGVRDKKTRAWEKYRRERRIGNRGTGPRVIRRPDLQHNTIFTYTFNSNFTPELKRKGGQLAGPDDEIVGIQTNENKIQKLCDQQIDATVASYQGTQPQVVSYRGLKFVECDGAIRQVMIQAGDDGFCETMASRDDEALGTDLRLNEKQQIGFLLDQFNRGLDSKWAMEKYFRQVRKAQN